LAQDNPRITVDEAGSGLLVFPGGSSFAMAGVLAPDPGPGGLGSALTFNLLGPPSLIAGDLLLTENGFADEVIRFNPAGTGGQPAYPASLVFYSVSGGGQLADTGFPTLNYATTFSATSTAGVNFLYTPTAAQPGFIGGFNVTYEIVSPANSAVPEPSSFALMLGGAVAVLLQRARRRRQAI